MVEFGRNDSWFGGANLEMVTFNAKHHWVFPLVPTARDYEKLDEYFGKLQKSEIETPQAQGDFADHLEVRKVNKTKNRRLESKMGGSKRLYRTCKIQFEILLREWRMLFKEVKGPKLTRGG